MKLSNYSLNYSELLDRNQMDLVDFLGLCRELGMEGASLHMGSFDGTDPEYLKTIRRAYLDNGLSLSMLIVTTDFAQPEMQAGEMEKVREAIDVAVFLGAPLLRVLSGSPPPEADRDEALQRAAGAVRKVCEEAAPAGLPIGLQNQPQGALCCTSHELLRFVQEVDHPNLTLVLDVGDLAGPDGASEEGQEDFMASVRQGASLSRHVRFKFHDPGSDGSESRIDYRQVFDILRGVHYPGFVDVVYEPQAPGQMNAREAVPRIVSFLRREAAVAPLVTARAQRSSAERYAGLSPDRFFVDSSPQAEIDVAFLEGPAVDRRGHVFFTEMRAERIYEWDPSARQVTVFRENTNRTNGLLFDSEGRLLACEGGAGRITRTDMRSGEITVLADHYQNRPLGAPNDLTIDERSRVYFTSRLPNRDPNAGNVNAVYRVDPDGSLTRVLAWPDIDMPNGIVTSPDSRTLYLIDADGSENRARRIRAYDLNPDGTVSNERLVYNFYPGRSGDGMAIDAEGNLYVAAGLHRRRGTSETLDTRPGIHVISPEGRLLAYVETPEDTITNCTFGGADLKTLYIACGKWLLSLRTRIAGKAAYRPDV